MREVEGGGASGGAGGATGCIGVGGGAGGATGCVGVGAQPRMLEALPCSQPRTEGTEWRGKRGELYGRIVELNVHCTMYSYMMVYYYYV